VRAVFTRVPARVENAQHQQAAQQLIETIDFLRGEDLLDDASIQIALPADSSTQLRDQLSILDAQCTILAKFKSEVKHQADKEDANVQLDWLQRMPWNSVSFKRNLSRYDLNRSTDRAPLSHLVRLKEDAILVLKRPVQLLLGLTPWILILVLMAD